MRKPDATALDWKTIQATMEFCKPTIRAMIELQWLTGMRTNEVISMRRCDLSLAQQPRRYAPVSRSYEQHHIPLGPKTEAIIWKFLPDKQEGYLFTTGRGDSSRHISASAYMRAIKSACKQAGVEPWSSYDLRRAFAERVRTEYGLSAVTAALGHCTNDPEHYEEV